MLLYIFGLCAIFWFALAISTLIGYNPDTLTISAAFFISSQLFLALALDAYQRKRANK